MRSSSPNCPQPSLCIFAGLRPWLGCTKWLTNSMKHVACRTLSGVLDGIWGGGTSAEARIAAAVLSLPRDHCRYPQFSTCYMLYATCESCDPNVFYI